MYTFRQYLTTLSDPCGLTRTLGEIDVCRSADGNPLCTAGNSAIVFRIRRDGRVRSLRCYRRPMRHLAAIYGDRFLPGEIFIYTSPENGVWVDAVLDDWIEGLTLQEAVAVAAQVGDTAKLAALSAAFDHLALELVTDDRAHGDLKPENIIVDATDGLHLIDLDASFLPAFAGEASPELGTAAYQHPARTAADFDARLDDYPAALISTALYALSLDPSLHNRYTDGDGLLFKPCRIRTDAALAEVMTLFEHRGMAVRCRIAELLLSPALRLYHLPALLGYAVSESGFPDGETPELFEQNGRWGYRTAKNIVVPALYDCGFDFTEGLAAVQLRRTWHFIDTAGRVVLSCRGCEAVKPFSGGRATVIRGGERFSVDMAGHEKPVDGVVDAGCVKL